MYWFVCCVLKMMFYCMHLSNYPSPRFLQESCIIIGGSNGAVSVATIGSSPDGDDESTPAQRIRPCCTRLQLRGPTAHLLTVPVFGQFARRRCAPERRGVCVSVARTRARIPQVLPPPPRPPPQKKTAARPCPPAALDHPAERADLVSLLPPPMGRCTSSRSRR